MAKRKQPGNLAAARCPAESDGPEPPKYFLRCHTDKSGPFAFEHAPMRIEGCSACHEAHVSTKPLLSRNEVRFVCLECHSNGGTSSASKPGQLLGSVPPAFYDFELAVHDIQPGEELTDDYGTLNIEESFDCYCMQAGCRGTIFPDDLLRYAQV